MVKLNEKYVTDRAGQRNVEDRLEIRRRKRNAKFVPWEQAKAVLKTK